MNRNVSAFLVGVLFAVGLGVGGMTNPAKIIGFLDFGGAWDPAMLLVMAGAVGVYALGYRLVTRRPRPLLVGVFSVPTPGRPDLRLLSGAAIFGVGWGLSGLCPGPAITSIATGDFGIYVFIVTMLVGLFIVPSRQRSTAMPGGRRVDADAPA